MESINFVYLLLFSNGKVYVGMSKTDRHGLYTSRYNNHAREAKNGNPLLVYNAWRKHGAPIQSILSIHETREECCLAEIDAIEKYDSTNPKNGYNILKGGQGQDSATNPIMYEIMRQKVWSNPNWRKKVSDALKGKPVSVATINGYKKWCKENPELKAEAAKLAWRDPQYKAMKSEATKLQMANGGAEHLKIKFKGRGDIRSHEGKEAQREKTKLFLKTDAGKEALKKAATATWSKPENREKILASLDKWRASDKNKEQCKAMAKLAAQKCSIKVRDNATGIVYNSQREMAQALGISDGAISLRVKKGNVTRL